MRLPTRFFSFSTCVLWMILVMVFSWFLLINHYKDQSAIQKNLPNKNDGNTAKEQIRDPNTNVLQTQSSRHKQEASRDREMKKDTATSDSKNAIATNKQTSSTSGQNASPIVLKQRREEFQLIPGSGSYVYSAYQVKNMVRTMLFLNKNGTKLSAFSCYFWGHENNLLGRVPARVIKNTDDHGLGYTAAFSTCLPSVQILSEPTLYLSIVYGKIDDKVSRENPNLVRVERPVKRKWKFVVCVAPMFKKYDRQFELLEMIEMNRLLGADHFFFYNLSVSDIVAKVLKHYHDKGIVDVVQWPIPPMFHFLPPKDNINKIHYNGQVASINDCVYRNWNRSEYVVITDIDEFIIPRGTFKNWSQLLDHRLSINPASTNFQFRNTFFTSAWLGKNNTFSKLDLAKKYHSVVLRSTLRQNKFFDKNIRSKTIVNPRLVNEAGIHYARPLTNKRTDYVPLEEAYLHHYRYQYDKDASNAIVDMGLIDRYGLQLIDSIEKEWKEIASK